MPSPAVQPNALSLLAAKYGQQGMDAHGQRGAGQPVQQGQQTQPDPMAYKVAEFERLLARRAAAPIPAGCMPSERGGLVNGMQTMDVVWCLDRIRDLVDRAGFMVWRWPGNRGFGINFPHSTRVRAWGNVKEFADLFWSLAGDAYVLDQLDNLPVFDWDAERRNLVRVR